MISGMYMYCLGQTTVSTMYKGSVCRVIFMSYLQTVGWNAVDDRNAVLSQLEDRAEQDWL